MKYLIHIRGDTYAGEAVVIGEEIHWLLFKEAHKSHISNLEQFKKDHKKWKLVPRITKEVK